MLLFTQLILLMKGLFFLSDTKKIDMSEEGIIEHKKSADTDRRSFPHLTTTLIFKI